MKRRRRKWPYVLGFLSVAAVSGFVFLSPIKKQPPIAVSSYTPVTWSQFNEHKRLQMLLSGFAIESMIDVPCVDIQALPDQQWSGIHYTGITASKDLASALQSQYGSEQKTFIDRDVTIDPLPRADLILCWDLLCTLRPGETRAAIEQFKRSGAHFLLMRHYPEIKQNQKNKTGTVQPVNWTLPPYDFPQPLIHIMEKGEHGMESLALWNLENL